MMYPRVQLADGDVERLRRLWEAQWTGERIMVSSDNANPFEPLLIAVPLPWNVRWVEPRPEPVPYDRYARPPLYFGERPVLL